MSNQKIKRFKQDKFYYSFSPLHEPTLRVKSGETLVIEVPDAFEGKVKTEKDKIPTAMNPMTGPIYVEGAEKGDALVIDIKDIKLTGDIGVSVLLNDTDLLNNMLLFQEPMLGVKMIPIKNDKISFVGMKTPSVPCEPSIGCIGTAPENETILTDYAGPYGGNMDTPDICIGARLFLPVNVPGGLLVLGDVHAIEGSGELFAVDISAEITLTINLLKQKRINWPRIETSDYIMTVISASPIRDAIWIAYKEMLLWIEDEYKLDKWDAYQLCTQGAVIQLSKIAPPTPTITVKFPKKYLPTKRI